MTLLTDAAAIVNTSGKWCKKANAKTSTGKWCSPLSPNAVAWDIYGALWKAFKTGAYVDTDFHAAYAHVRAKIPVNFPNTHQHNADIEMYNDSLAFGSVAGIFA